jgi:hypothetical protein
MGDARSGVAQAIVAAGPLGLPAEAEELDLFDGSPHAGSPIDEAARAQGAAEVKVAGRRGPGRPKGSRNASTEQILSFIQARYRHPLLGLADIASTSPEQLALLLAGGRKHMIDEETRWRAWQLCLTATKELTEYMLPKQPRAITMTADSAPLIQMFMGLPAAPGGAFGVSGQPMFGLQEMPVNTGASPPKGEEVLEGEVLEPAKSAGESNA